MRRCNRGFPGREPPAGDQTEGDRRVEVPAGDVAEGVGAGEHGEPERQAHADEADAEIGVGHEPGSQDR